MSGPANSGVSISTNTKQTAKTIGTISSTSENHGGPPPAAPAAPSTTTASAPAVPSGISSVAAPKKNAKGNGNDPPLRQGKWTREEEEYVHCLIDEFKTGMMPLAEGTSLRTFLSKMLNCHPMRISKKFVGSNYNGKQVYTRRTGADRLSNEEVLKRREKLCGLERKFLAKISGGKTSGSTGSASRNAAAAAAAMPPTLSSLQLPANMNNMASALSLQNLTGGSSGGLGNRGVSVSSSGIELRSLLNQAAVNQTNPRSTTDVPSTIRNMLEGSLNNPSASSASLGQANSNSSSHSLQNIFQELMANSSSNNNLGGHANNNSTSSLEAFQLMLQQHSNSNMANGNHAAATSHHQPKSNARAAAAGRALLQSGLGNHHRGGGGGGGGDGSSDSGNGLAGKPLASYTSAELAEELRKRSSLKDILDSLSSCGSNNNLSSNNNNAVGNSNNLSQSFQNLRQAAESKNADAFSSLMGKTSMDVSNLIERQGSIDSLSNLAMRSKFQSLQSMGDLLDPILEGGNIGGSSSTSNLAAGGDSNHNNSSWTVANQQGNNMNQFSNVDLTQLATSLNSGLVSLEQLGLFNNNASASSASRTQQQQQSQHQRTANELMESLGVVSRSSLDNLAANNNAVRAISSSGLDLASLLNNDDALRRLEAAAPSSLHQNFSFDNNNNNSNSMSNHASARKPASLSTPSQSDSNTAIAQFLLQKKLLEGRSGGGNNSNDNEQQQLMMNVAAAAGVGGAASLQDNNTNTGCSHGNSSSNNTNSNTSGMDPIMSSLLSSLRASSSMNSGDDHLNNKPSSSSIASQLQQQQQSSQNDLESLKRKFLSHEGLMAAVAQQEEHRRNKPFR